MAFKNIINRPQAPDSPEKLFLEFTRRKFPTVLPHQSSLISSYVKKGQAAPDVALQLPTGSGKTLVGLLIAEWLLRKNHERVVYLCPTAQLVNQVVEQASQQYGMNVLGFTRQKRDYDPASKAEYHNAEKVAVTTYNSVFNTDPFFNDPSVILIDDAHAAENYFSSMWTIEVKRNEPTQTILHAALTGVLARLLDPSVLADLKGSREAEEKSGWVDKLPTPDFLSVAVELVEILDVHADDAGLFFQWQSLRPIFHACHLYMSRNSILIRPLIAPTWTHLPFTNARQRIYMSATLGAGGDLERLTGRKSILRLPLPTDFPTQGVGRRFFIFPDMALADEDNQRLRNGLMSLAQRALVLVPSDREANAAITTIRNELGYQTYTAKDLEHTTAPFVSTKPGVAVISGRYDGIDFPGDHCRLLFLDGLPKATNLQERFIMSRMGANVLYNERIMSRVLQAIGRCTRSLLDYSAVVLSGGDLPSYLGNPQQRAYFSVELQSEIEFGIAQSKHSSVEDLVENCRLFLENGPEWQAANDQILRIQSSLAQVAFPALSILQEIAPLEIEFQTQLCNRDFEGALASAEHILGNLTDAKLQGYRALWHYLAGAVAYQASNGQGPMSQNARNHFHEAKKAAPIQWLAALAKFQVSTEPGDPDEFSAVAQVEAIEKKLEQLGSLHDRKFTRLEQQILSGLASRDPENSKPFEDAHLELGKLLGFTGGKIENDGSPDPWWLLKEHFCFVFEDHAGAKLDGSLSASKARQAMAHPDWIKAHLGLASEEVFSILITPAKSAAQGAMPILHHFYIWPLEEFEQWAKSALSVLRSLRAAFPGSGDMIWKAEAMQRLKDSGLDPASIKQHALTRPASVYFGK